jgi:hypothetical protein
MDGLAKKGVYCPLAHNVRQIGRPNFSQLLKTFEDRAPLFFRPFAIADAVRNLYQKILI